MKVLGLVFTLLLVSANVSATPLKTGDALPVVQGKSLDGSPGELPKGLGGKTAVIAFGFSRDAGGVIRSWAEQIGNDAIVYQVPVLEGVPRLFRSLTESSIRKDSGEKYKDRVLMLYREEKEWRSRLGVADDKTAHIVVVDTTGRVVDRLSGAPSAALIERVRSALSGSAPVNPDR